MSIYLVLVTCSAIIAELHLPIIVKVLAPFSI